MSRHRSLAFLLVVLVYGLSILFAPRPALAANSCDFNTCLNQCRKANPQWVAVYCSTTCVQTLEERKKKGQCKGNLTGWDPVTD
jgi:hypothetical protein